MAIMIHTSTVIVKGLVKWISGSRVSEHQKTGFRDDHIKTIGLWDLHIHGIWDFIISLKLFWD